MDKIKKYSTAAIAFITGLKKNYFLLLYISAAVYTYISITNGNHLNNFTIFRSSFYHLLNGLSLYTLYPNEYYDYFLYSPAFPLLFSMFAILKSSIGVLAWLFFTAIFCFRVFKKLPFDDQKTNFFIFFIFFNLLNNFGHTQTNPVMLALMLLFWELQGKGKNILQGLVLTLCFLIKGYGAIIGLLLLFEKDRYKTILYAALWFLIINCSLLFFVSPLVLFTYYQDWLTLISGTGVKESVSVYGILKNLSLEGLNEIFILLFAFALLAVFLTCEYVLDKKNKPLVVAFLLIWVTVFNRGAEGATYIIAIAGVILWHLGRPPGKFANILFWTTIIFSSIFPVPLISFIDVLKRDYYLHVALCLIVLGDILVLKIKETYYQQSLKKVEI